MRIIVIITPQVIIDFFIYGIMKGGIYALFAMGLAIIFGVLRVVNVAHGDIYTLGGYIAFFAATLIPNPIFAVVVAAAGGFLIGVCIDKSTNYQLRKKRMITTANMMVMTFGIAFFLENLMLILWGPKPRKIPPIIKGVTVLFGTQLATQRLVIIFTSLAIVAVFFIFLYKTRTGIAIRAVSQDVITAQALGIDIEIIYPLTFGIGAALATTAGSLIGSLFYITPAAGFALAMRGFVVIVFGGIGSTTGALIGGLILGLTEAFASLFIGEQYALALFFLVMIITLVLRPSGLMGEKLA